MTKPYGFVEFIEAQITVMRKDIRDVDTADVETGNKRIAEWIETHASEFRAQWEKNRAGRKIRHAVE